MEFVLVHGTTQSPAGWDRLAGGLGARGHRVTLIDLPVGQPEWMVTDYAREAAAQAGNPAGRRVVVAHSGAGVLLPAIAGAAEASGPLPVRFPPRESRRHPGPDLGRQVKRCE